MGRCWSKGMNFCYKMSKFWGSNAHHGHQGLAMGDWMKVGEGISQRTYTHDPWVQTRVW